MRKLFALLALPSLLLAQVETARIIGSVKDQTGAVIPNANITFLNTATNISYETRAKADGAYESIPLRVGSYRVTATLDGFKEPCAMACSYRSSRPCSSTS